jgi:peptidoglycan hydrolase CwlO-like protein
VKVGVLIGCLALSTGALSSCERSTNSPIDKVYAYLNEDAQDIKGLQDRVGDLQSKTNDLESKGSDLESKVNRLESKTDDLEHRIGR